MLKELKLYKAVIALFKIVVIRRHMKKGAVCLVGAPNTGKTELLNRMA